MHRKPESEFVPLDTELERTLRNLKKVRFFEVVVMAVQTEIIVEEVGRPQVQTIMEDFGNRLLEMIIL